jgi:hypothetical protein
MTIYNIPVENAPELGVFDMIVDMDGSDFQLTFAYNPRDGFWYVDVADVAGNPIRSGLKCVINYPLMRLCKEQGRPLGEIFVIDPRPTSEETGLDGFGSDGLLTYVDEESLG